MFSWVRAIQVNAQHKDTFGKFFSLEHSSVYIAKLILHIPLDNNSIIYAQFYR